MAYNKDYKEYGLIYSLTSPSGKMYIGQTTKSLNKRLACYRALLCKDQPKLYNSLKKYGLHNFQIRVLGYYNTQEELDTDEKYFIKKYNTIDDGYNIQLGGYSQRFTTAIREKISATKKKRNKGKIHNWTGKHHSEETKQKLRKISLGRKLRPHTEEWKKSNSLRMRGKNNHFYGVPFFLGQKHSDTTKKKISRANSRIWYIEHFDGRKIILVNLKSFVENIN